MKQSWLVAVAAMCAGLAGCGEAQEPSTTSEAAEMTTTTAGAPLLVFDGETCSYQGPAETAGGGLIDVTLENRSDIDIDAAVFWVRSDTALAAAFERLPPGTGSGITLGAPRGSRFEAWLQAPAGGSNKESLLLDAGLYLLDCARVPYGATNPDYLWRGGSFAVVDEPQVVD